MRAIISPLLCSEPSCSAKERHMTTGEILIIAAAAAVFIIINIIMWSVIAKKERRADANAAPQSRMTEVPLSEVSAAAAAAGFELMENTVIVHTDDVISD